jgi:hypothetical protein
MSVIYDESVIVQFAERHYRRASSIVAAYVLLSGSLGAVVAAFGASYAAHNNANASIGTPTLVVGVVCAFLGGLVGNERAFALRLMAQSALCQVQIERNTRSMKDLLRAATERRGTTSPPPVPAPR